MFAAEDAWTKCARYCRADFIALTASPATTPRSWKCGYDDNVRSRRRIDPAQPVPGLQELGIHPRAAWWCRAKHLLRQSALPRRVHGRAAPQYRAWRNASAKRRDTTTRRKCTSCAPACRFAISPDRSPSTTARRRASSRPHRTRGLSVIHGSASKISKMRRAPHAANGRDHDWRVHRSARDPLRDRAGREKHPVLSVRSRQLSPRRRAPEILRTVQSVHGLDRHRPRSIEAMTMRAHVLAVIVVTALTGGTPTPSIAKPARARGTRGRGGKSTASGVGTRARRASTRSGFAGRRRVGRAPARAKPIPVAPPRRSAYCIACGRRRKPSTTASRESANERHDANHHPEGRITRTDYSVTVVVDIMEVAHKAVGGYLEKVPHFHSIEFDGAVRQVRRRCATKTANLIARHRFRAIRTPTNIGRKHCSAITASPARRPTILSATSSYFSATMNSWRRYDPCRPHLGRARHAA